QAGVGMLEEVQTLRIRGHHAVLDAVVHHFDEVPGAVRTAVQIAHLGRGLGRAPARAGLLPPAAGRESREDRLEGAEHSRLGTDHQTIALLEPEHTAARTGIDVVDACRAQLLGPANIVLIVGIAAVDEDVAGGEPRPQLRNDAVNDGSGHHDPDRAWRLEGGGELRERVGGDGAIRRNCLHRFPGSVIGDAFVAASYQPAHHVGAHAPEPHHSDSHTGLLYWRKVGILPLCAANYIALSTSRPRERPWAAQSLAFGQVELTHALDVANSECGGSARRAAPAFPRSPRIPGRCDRCARLRWCLRQPAPRAPGSPRP